MAARTAPLPRPDGHERACGRRGARRPRGAMAAGLALALAAAGVAHAYVRYRNAQGVPLTWAHSCIDVTPDARGSSDVSRSEILDALDGAALNWTERTTSCSPIRIVPSRVREELDAANDRRSVVVFREDRWERADGEVQHDPSAIGVATLFSVAAPGQPGDGSLVDADIELNAVHFTFTTDPLSTMPRPGTEIADLQNVLTHELGHVLGLRHNCWDRTTDSPPLDDQGQEVPDCRAPNLPDAITHDTMYAYQLMPGETIRRTVTDDNARAICEAYPNNNSMGPCFAQLRGGGCAAGGRAGGGAGAAALVGVTILAAARARMRRAGPPRP